MEIALSDSAIIARMDEAMKDGVKRLLYWMDTSPSSLGYLSSQDTSLVNVEIQPHSVQFCRTVSVYTRWRVTNDPPRSAIYPRPDLSVAIAFTWPKRAEVVAPWRSLNFYSGFMRFACQRRPRGLHAGRGENLMMMYRGRAVARRENGRERVPPGLCSLGNERRV